MSDYVAFRTLDRKLAALFLGCPDYLKRIIITAEQVRVVELISGPYDNCMSAKEFAAHEGCSIQSASTRLSALWRTGYLARRAIVSKSGGVEYRYRSVVHAALK